MWIYIVIGLLFLIIVGLIIALILVNKSHRRAIVEINNRVDKEVTRIREAARVQTEMRETQIKLEDESIRNYEGRIEDLNRTLEEKQAQLRKLEDNIKDAEERSWRLTVYLKTLDESVADNREVLDGINTEKFLTLEEQKSLDEAIAASKTASMGLSKDIENLSKELEELKEKKRLAILYQDEIQNDWWDFSITQYENELISILERIKMDYPDLKTDISTIEWKRIWLPKIQDMTNEHELDGVKCIYRLILKADENICYVGQAVNVKERWYQHIKKMIGVDAKGNEKLYNYKPDDFWWSIVEENPQDLNESEHYWIEYFGCKERGLNRKA